MNRALILEDIKESRENIRRLERELKALRPKPFMFIDDWGDKADGMYVGTTNGDSGEDVVHVELAEISMDDIPAVIAWLNKVIGEENE